MNRNDDVLEGVEGRSRGWALLRSGTVYATQAAAPPELLNEGFGRNRSSKLASILPHMFPDRYGRPILFRNGVTVNTFGMLLGAIHPSLGGNRTLKTRRR